MEERLKILKLLEEGKINASEAATLLEALGPESKRETEWSLGGIVSDTMDSVSSVLSTIPGMVKAGLSLGVAEGGRSVQASSKERVVIKCMGGDLEIGFSKDMVRGEVDSGLIRSFSSEKELTLKVMGGDAKFSLPRLKELRISCLGGDLSGEIEARAVSVSLEGGDVDLSLRDFEDAVIKTNGGDIDLAIPEDANLSLDLEAQGGEVRCDLPLNEEERGENFLRGVLNQPEGKFEAKAMGGDIRIKGRDRRAEMWKGLKKEE